MGNYYKISWERYVIQLLIYWVVASLILAAKSFFGVVCNIIGDNLDGLDCHSNFGKLCFKSIY